VPVVNIAQIFQHSGLQLTCRRDSSVRRPADLKAKTIAVWFAGNEFPFLAWMAKLGLSTTGDKPDVTVLRQGAGVELLVEGRAACISTMSYNEYWQVIDAGMKPSQLVVFRYDDEGVATLEDGLYALSARLADRAMLERLARFARASVAGWRFAAAPEHEAETVRILLRQGASDASDPRQGGTDAARRRQIGRQQKPRPRLSGAGRLRTHGRRPAFRGLGPGDPKKARGRVDPRGLGPGIRALAARPLTPEATRRRRGAHCSGPAISASSSLCRDAENGFVTVTPFQVKPSWKSSDRSRRQPA
jgi:hypothetical protein